MTDTLIITSGVDATGPWATLECSADHCDSHEAVRPYTASTHADDLSAALIDFAEQDGWTIDNGPFGAAYCPRHDSCTFLGCDEA